jgi:hypothetical protein
LNSNIYIYIYICICECECELGIKEYMWFFYNFYWRDENCSLGRTEARFDGAPVLESRIHRGLDCILYLLLLVRRRLLFQESASPRSPSLWRWLAGRSAPVPQPREERWTARPVSWRSWSDPEPCLLLVISILQFWWFFLSFLFLLFVLGSGTRRDQGRAAMWVWVSLSPSLSLSPSYPCFDKKNFIYLLGC